MLYRKLATLSILLTCLAFEQVHGKIFERCELARALRGFGIPNDQIGTWLCIANFESNYNTAAVNTASGDHGIFQISQLWWCSPPGNGKGCGISCAQLENDNIADDVQCALKIYNEHQRIEGNGFKAWVAYVQHCQDKNYANSFANGC